MGKGSIATRLDEQVPHLWLSRSWTTRPPRPHEPSDAYHFVDRATFEAAIEADRFLEWAEVFGELYGTPVPDPPSYHDILLEIDVQGAEQVLRRRPEAVLIFIEAPSREAQEQRLRGRGDDDATVAKRLAAAAREEEAGRALATHVVINDRLARAVDEVAGIVEEHRNRRQQSLGSGPRTDEERP